jgi:hypothetical protein
MSRTADDLAAAIRGRTEAVLTRRPDGKNWAANEVICHLRDIEEVYFVRSHSILINDDPKLYADPSAADRLAEDRQYPRNDAGQARPRSGGGVKNRWRCSVPSPRNSDSAAVCIRPGAASRSTRS